MKFETKPRSPWALLYSGFASVFNPAARVKTTPNRAYHGDFHTDRAALAQDGRALAGDFRRSAERLSLPRT